MCRNIAAKATRSAPHTSPGMGFGESARNSCCLLLYSMAGKIATLASYVASHDSNGSLYSGFESSSHVHVCAGLHIVRQRLDVDIKSLLDLVQDCRVLLRGHKCNGQALGAEAASTAHLEAHGGPHQSLPSRRHRRRQAWVHTIYAQSSRRAVTRRHSNESMPMGGLWLGNPPSTPSEYCR